MSGIQAIQSFTASSSSSSSNTATTTFTPPLTSPVNLPWLLALYDYLNDDDEEIRDAAATAAAPVLGKPCVSIEAGARLLTLLSELYGAEESFRLHAAGRLVGHGHGHQGEAAETETEWTPAETQLARALRFDDALFVVEEQNLYVDEVREATRWRDALFSSSSSSSSSPDDSAVTTSSNHRALLTQWTTAGLRTLSRIAAGAAEEQEQREEGGGGGDDGVLGWTSKPEVFAICARIAIAGAALSSSGSGDEGVRQELRAFVELGRKTRVHGLLLQMCEV
jgi:hypothetical protein